MAKRATTRARLGSSSPTPALDRLIAISTLPSAAATTARLLFIPINHVVLLEFTHLSNHHAPKVHSGFFASAKAISRRVKELLVSATAGTPGEWDLLITGHSLGGALAQLMATELVGSVDVSRGFKQKDDSSLFGMAKRFVSQAKQVTI